MDTTIKAATVQEKYESLKAQIVKKNHWNEEEDLQLRASLGLPPASVIGTSPEESVKPVKVPKQKQKKAKVANIAPVDVMVEPKAPEAPVAPTTE